MIMLLATDLNGCIGKDNKLPWKCPSDMKHFRELTLGNTVVMGRKTYESLGSKPLPDRNNIVITRNKKFNPNHPDVEVVYDQYELMDLLVEPKHINKTFLIGGADTYRSNFLLCNSIIISTINTEVEGGDSFFDINEVLEYEFIENKKYVNKHLDDPTLKEGLLNVRRFLNYAK